MKTPYAVDVGEGFICRVATGPVINRKGCAWLMINLYLEDLESRIDEEAESKLMKSWIDFTGNGNEQGPFTPKRASKSPPGILWPAISINTAIADIDKMVLHQYAGCSASLEEGRGDLLCVRANYGTSIIPSLFGVELYMMDEKHNTLPTSKSLPGGTAALKRLLDKGIPDIFSGYGEKVFRVGERLKTLSRQYPKIARHVHAYHPDLQGPLDVCELLAGSDLFLIIVDDPELVKELLALVTETYLRFMREWLKIWPLTGDSTVHWGFHHKGHVMLRNDSMMNFSPAMYEEFVKPFDRKILDAFGGGAIHFCGRGDHYIGMAAGIPGVYAVNMSQPEYNKQDVIFRHTIKKGIRLLGYNQLAVPGALDSLGKFKNAIHCPAPQS